MALLRKDGPVVEPFHPGKLAIGTTFTGKIDGQMGCWWRLPGGIQSLDDPTYTVDTARDGLRVEAYREVDIEYTIRREA